MQEERQTERLRESDTEGVSESHLEERWQVWKKDGWLGQQGRSVEGGSMRLDRIIRK